MNTEINSDMTMMTISGLEPFESLTKNYFSYLGGENWMISFPKGVTITTVQTVGDGQLAEMILNYTYKGRDYNMVSTWGTRYGFLFGIQEFGLGFLSPFNEEDWTTANNSIPYKNAIKERFDELFDHITSNNPDKYEIVRNYFERDCGCEDDEQSIYGDFHDDYYEEPAQDREWDPETEAFERWELERGCTD
jgi:hypothetical protein